MGNTSTGDCKELAGSLTFWTEESIRWYETASAFTGYHSALRKIIEPMLRPGDSCCELACGTGALARTLAPLVKDYTANDIDTAAAAYIRSLILPGNMSFVHGDWREIMNGRRFDVVLFSFFGAVLRDWEQLCGMADRSVIMVLPRKHKGHRGRHHKEVEGASSAAAKATLSTDAAAGSQNAVQADAAAVASAAAKAVLSTDATAVASSGNDAPRDEAEKKGGKRNYETGPDVSQILTEKGIPFQRLDVDLEFGQPFTDREDALRYIMHYYRLDREKADQFAEKKLETREGHFYFPKEKELSIITADVSGRSSLKDH